MFCVKMYEMIHFAKRLNVTLCVETKFYILYENARCRVLQSVTVCCSVLQGGTECCSVLQCVAEVCRGLESIAVLRSVAECCTALQSVADS